MQQGICHNYHEILQGIDHDVRFLTGWSLVDRLGHSPRTLRGIVNRVCLRYVGYIVLISSRLGPNGVAYDYRTPFFPTEGVNLFLTSFLR